MPNAQLPVKLVEDLLSDAAEVGFPTVRLYGGEPLLHPHLPRFIEHSLSVGMKPVITTNGIRLKEKIRELYGAGLRSISIGYYGFAESYDDYVSRKGAFSQLERSIAAVRDSYGKDVHLQLNFLLTRQTCSVDLLRRAWAFAEQYHMVFQVDLVHYSLPYFSEGPGGTLQFSDMDRDKLLRVTRELLQMKATQPGMLSEPDYSIKSLPDWALRQSDMQIPCDAYKMLWVGADGTVRLCYAAFPLGNLHETRLRDIFASREHRAACQQAFQLQCPRCHCERPSRIQSHFPSRKLYRRPLPPDVASSGAQQPTLPIIQ